MKTTDFTLTLTATPEHHRAEFNAQNLVAGFDQYEAAIDACQRTLDDLRTAHADARVSRMLNIPEGGLVPPIKAFFDQPDWADQLLASLEAGTVPPFTTGGFTGAGTKLEAGTVVPVDEFVLPLSSSALFLGQRDWDQSAKAAVTREAARSVGVPVLRQLFNAWDTSKYGTCTATFTVRKDGTGIDLLQADVVSETVEPKARSISAKAFAAKSLRAAGYSLREIGEALSVSKTHAARLAKGEQQ